MTIKLTNYLKILIAGILIVVLGSVWLSANAKAADIPGNFSLLITPSPIVETLTPGQTSTIQLKILNNSGGAEHLQIQPKSFVVDNATGSVRLDSTPPADISSWVSFSSPKFTVAAGQVFTENVVFTVPKDAGFSYSFALLIKRQTDTVTDASARNINGSVADFVLLNVDRPGAVRQLSVPSFTQQTCL